MGMLNKNIYKKIKNPIYLFEINLEKIIFPCYKKISFISKYPMNIRDITILINKEILLNDIIKKCFSIDPKKIKEINITKIFTNEKIKSQNKKNITLSLKIQDNKKTLNDIEINNLIKKCKKMLKNFFNAFIK